MRPNWPTFTHPTVSTSPANAGSVSPSKATAATRRPCLRASAANTNGNRLLPAINPNGAPCASIRARLRPASLPDNGLASGPACAGILS